MVAKSKGFRRPERTIVVEFAEGTDWHGAEVVCRRDVTIKRLVDFEALASGDISELARGLRDFGDELVVSWNLEEGGADVPVGGESLCSWPVDFGMSLVRGWLEGATTIGAPLVDESGSGEQ